MFNPAQVIRQHLAPLQTFLDTVESAYSAYMAFQSVLADMLGISLHVLYSNYKRPLCKTLFYFQAYD